MTIKEASKYLNVAEKTLYKWVNERRIPFVKLSRKTLRFDIDVIEKWIKEHMVEEIAPDYFINESYFKIKKIDFVPDKRYNKLKKEENGNF
ncbi:MAG: helix-turn-helix domain-containing protein [candidate division WOR-3 bacterium]